MEDSEELANGHLADTSIKKPTNTPRIPHAAAWNDSVLRRLQRAPQNALEPHRRSPLCQMSHGILCKLRPEVHFWPRTFRGGLRPSFPHPTARSPRVLISRSPWYELGEHVTNTSMPQQLLDRADVVAVFQEMGGERVPECAARRALGDPTPANRPANGLLHGRRVEMVAHFAAIFAARPLPGRKDVLPQPFRRCIRVLPLQGIRKGRPAVTRREVAGLNLPHALEVIEELDLELLRQQRHAALAALAIVYGHLSVREVEILDAEP